MKPGLRCMTTIDLFKRLDHLERLTRDAIFCLINPGTTDAEKVEFLTEIHRIAEPKTCEKAAASVAE